MRPRDLLIQFALLAAIPGLMLAFGLAWNWPKLAWTGGIWLVGVVVLMLITLFRNERTP